MSLRDYLVNTSEYTGKDIEGLPDQPPLSAEELKRRFDSMVKNLIAPKHNDLIYALDSTADGLSGADGVKATAINGLTGTSVQALLESLNTLKMDKAGGAFTGNVAFSDVVEGTTSYGVNFAQRGLIHSVNNVLRLLATGGVECRNYDASGFTPFACQQVTLNGLHKLYASGAVVYLREGNDGTNVSLNVPSVYFGASTSYITRNTAGDNSLLLVSTGYPVRAVTDAAVGLAVTKTNLTTFAPVNASAFTVGSSVRFKDIISGFTREQSAGLLDIDLINFRYKPERGDDGKKHMGVKAEQVYELFPDAVTLDEEELPSGVDYSKLVVPCIGMIQQMEKRISKLEKRS